MSGRRTRVLITADAVGGVWQYATDLARGLAGQGVEPVLAVLGPAPRPEHRTTAAGLEAIETGLPLDWLAEDRSALEDAAEALARLAEDQAVDLIQLNTPALAGLTGFPAPVITVAHSCVATWWAAVKGGEPPADFSWRTELMRAGLAAAGRVVAPSASFAAAVQRAYLLREPPAVVHNGRTLMASPSTEPQGFAFTAGRLWDEGKGLATLDRAAGLLSVPVRAAGPLIGPNGARIAFEHINALGSLSEAELGVQLAARPVFVSAARYEPFGLAVLEAAQAGCALVLSDIPTFRELWDGAALFVAADDAEGFARAINALICDPARRRALGESARGRAARYNVEAMAARMAALYRATLAKSPPQRVAA